MKILFLTVVKIDSLEERGIYTDLLRKFRDEGHSCYVICPVERKYNIATNLKRENGATLLQVRSFNMQQTNIFEKGFGILALEYQFLRALKKYFSNEKFDLVLYSTPPVTFTKVIDFIKKRDNAYAYLLLKDIFPQNAVDMHLIKKGSYLHKVFLKKERKLYHVSDTIGCMSKANKEFIIKHNTFLDLNKIEVNPNSIDPVKVSKEFIISKSEVRNKFDLPLDKKIFIYGGNLGLPQGISFLLKTIEECTLPQVFFLIVGSGREYNRIEQWFTQMKPRNAMLLKSMPKSDYDSLVQTCDVGLIFLNPEFTTPNFPSRLLSYLEHGMPVLAATDKSTDVGQVIEEANCGIWVHSGDIHGILCAIKKLAEDKVEFTIMKENARKLLEKEYLVEMSYYMIINKISLS